MTNVFFMLLFRVVSVKWSHDHLYKNTCESFKEVTFRVQSTTSGTGILEEGKLVILVGSFLYKYNLFIISLLFVVIWSIT